MSHVCVAEAISLRSAVAAVSSYALGPKDLNIGLDGRNAAKGLQLLDFSLQWLNKLGLLASGVNHCDTELG